MNVFDALVLGLVQGLTEFIPVSSSGHLILFNEVFSLNSTFNFDLVLNVGTLAAAIIYFRNDLYELLFKSNRHKLLLITVGTVPAVLAGVALKDIVSTDSARSQYVVSTMLLVVGVLFILESLYKPSKTTSIKNLSPVRALLIGIAQAVALIPGTSRSGSTILAGRFVGLTRADAARFSFLLSIPIISGAIGYSLIDEPLNLAEIGALNVSVGIIASFASSMLAIHFMLRYLRKKGLKVFGWYRVVLAVMVLFVL